MVSVISAERCILPELLEQELDNQPDEFDDFVEGSEEGGFLAEWEPKNYHPSGIYHREK